MATLNKYLGGRVNKRKKLIPCDKEELGSIIGRRLEESLNLDLNDIDMSEIEDMKRLFEYLDFSSVDISSWNIDVIDEYMFHSCKNLKSVILPYSIKSIESNAFAYCNKLTEISIPNSVKSIGQYAFWKCNKLTDITIPDSVKNIGDCAFYNVPHITYHGPATWASGNKYWGAKIMN